MTAAEYGTSSGELLVLPLTYGPESVGQLVLSPRAPAETFTASDLRVLEDLARQVGVTTYAVRLTAYLQRSRERLIVAREEERRRLKTWAARGYRPPTRRPDAQAADRPQQARPRSGCGRPALRPRGACPLGRRGRSVHALREAGLGDFPVARPERLGDVP